MQKNQYYKNWYIEQQVGCGRHQQQVGSGRHQQYQIGGGACSICGSPNTTKITCPCNPEAKNPNPAKHPLCDLASIRKTTQAIPSKALPKKELTKSSFLEKKQKKKTEIKIPQQIIAEPSILAKSQAKAKAHAKAKKISTKCINTPYKYLNQLEPPFPAKYCCGLEMRGNNGGWFKSQKVSNQCRWQPIK